VLAISTVYHKCDGGFGISKEDLKAHSGYQPQQIDFTLTSLLNLKTDNSWLLSIRVNTSGAMMTQKKSGQLVNYGPTEVVVEVSS